MALILMMCMLRQDTITIRDTALYKPWAYLTVNPQGEVYLIDSEMKIRHYSSEGNLMRVFGGRGQGPGEFMVAFNLGYVDGALWVQDAARRLIHVFSREGEFLRSLFSEKMTAYTHRVTGGWLSIDYPRERGETGRLILFDRDMEASKVVFTWEPTWTHEPKVYPKEIQHKRLAINPAREQSFVKVSRDGRFAYILPPGYRLEIHVLDIEKEKLVRTIELPDKPIPFNEAWGWEKVNASNKLSRTGFKASLDAPDTFPIARGLGLTHDGLLWLTHWSAHPDRDKPQQLVTHSGEVLHGKDSAAYRRIYDVVNGRGYLSGYEDDEAVVYIVPEAEIHTFIAQHPIHFEKKEKGLFVSIK